MAITNVLKWIPVLTVQCLGFGILYMYLLVVKHWKCESQLLKFIEFFPFPLLLLYELSFMRTVLAPIPRISGKYQAFAPDFIAPNLLFGYCIYTRTSSNEPRYCRICATLQPDRAWHCESCGACVLRMDHHCYWMNNCIHFGNYKFFLLTQFYGAMTCLVMATSCCVLMVKLNFPKLDSKSALDFYTILPALAVVFIGLGSICLYYLRLVFANQTLMERTFGIYLENGKQHNHFFDLGWKQNFVQVFGDCFLLVCVPIFTSKGNGEVFPVSVKGESNICELAEIPPSIRNQCSAISST
ncbi:palmitoyltransferase ZDHHC20-A-like [Hermetia illucens]|uniref:palmitoyltransferase ZDHHC20-A-like n=1 Tax=Hermetia illucens TaxID=343691 RepID=UPI0018CC1FA6|nr:palmitoyltransferase ZDHHC20-A-like [Hermetia illucens]